MIRCVLVFIYEFREQLLEKLKMTRKYPSWLTALCLVAAIFFSISPNISAHHGSPANPPGGIPPSGNGIEGFWLGALDAGTFKLRLLMKFSRTPDGKLTGLLDSLDQSAKDIPMDTVSFQDGSLHVGMKSLGASYDGKMSADGTQITGEFTQGAKLPLTLKRI